MAFSISSSQEGFLELNAIESGNNNNNDNKDRFKNIPPELLENVYLTQTLESVYQIFVLGLLVVFSLRYAITLYKLKRKVTSRLRLERSGFEAAEDETNGDVSTRQALEEEGENEPLLVKRKKPGLLVRKFRAWSIRSPPSFPIIGIPATSNLQLLFFVFFYFVNVVFFFLGHLPTLQTIWMLGYRAGGLIISNLPWLYLLSAKNQPLKFLTGYSYESLNICHRALGYMICFLALCHVFFTVSGFYMLSRLGATGTVTLGHFLRINIFVLGEIAFGCYLVLFVTSLGAIRRRLYETFLTSHVLFQVVALFLIFFHHPRARVPTSISLLIFLVDRFLFRLWLKSSSFIASTDISADGETCLLSADISSDQKRSGVFSFNRSVRAGWHAGQHVFLSIPELGRKYLWQAHPFSISSVPPQSQNDEGRLVDYHGNDSPKKLDILVRTHDGFSRDVACHAQSNPKVRIRVDGPYGSSLLPKKLFAADTCLFIAGGTGIAVISPLLQATLATHRTSSTSDRDALIWVVKDDQHRSWAPGQAATDLQSRNLAVMVPPATNRLGRPCLSALVHDALDSTRRDETNISKPRPTGSLDHEYDRRAICIVVSGPDSMVHEVRTTCSKLLDQGLDVDLHVEKFGY